LRERVLAIVSFIAQYVLEERQSVNETDLVEELLAVGFEAEEIDAAFQWMESMARPVGDGVSPFDPTSHRVFSPEEARALSQEAQGFLIRLRMMGILDDEVAEEVIDRALQADEELSLKEIQAITALSLFTRSQYRWHREIDCILEDDWPRIYH